MTTNQYDQTIAEIEAILDDRPFSSRGLADICVAGWIEWATYAVVA